MIIFIELDMDEFCLMLVVRRLRLVNKFVKGFIKIILKWILLLVFKIKWLK